MVPDDNFWDNPTDAFGVDWAKIGGKLPVFRVRFVGIKGQFIGMMIIPAVDEHEAVLDARMFNHGFMLFPYAVKGREQVTKITKARG